MSDNIDERECIDIHEEPYASSQNAQMIYMRRKIRYLFPGLMMGYLEYMMFYYSEGSLDSRLSKIQGNWSGNYFKKLSKVIHDRDCNEFDNMTKNQDFARLINQDWNLQSRERKRISSLFVEFANQIGVSLVLFNFEGRISIYGNSDFYVYFTFNKPDYEILYPYYDRIETFEIMIRNSRNIEPFNLPRKQIFSCGCFVSEMRKDLCFQQLSKFELSMAQRFIDINQCNCPNPDKVFRLWCDCVKCEFCAVKQIRDSKCVDHPDKPMKDAQKKSIVYYLNEKFSHDTSRKCKCKNSHPIARILRYLPQHHNCDLCKKCFGDKIQTCKQCKNPLNII